MDRKTKKLKKNFKYLREIMREDPAMVDIVARELLKNSLKYGPGDIYKIWKKTAKYIREDAYGSIDSIIGRTIR